MEKARVGSPLATGVAARATALVVLTGIVLFLGAALVSPAAQARPRTVCCFRVTVEVSGAAQATYHRIDKTDSQGNYDYGWEGTAYGIAHLQGSGLRTDRGVGAGYLREQNHVTEASGQPRDRNDPGCSGEELSSRMALGKTRYGYPLVGLGNGGMAFGRPFEHWELNCGSLATETLFDLQAGNHAWNQPRQFFFNGHIRGLSSRQLALGHTQEVTCIEHSSRGANPRMASFGFSAVAIKIVPFPASDLEHQQHRLAGFLGKGRNWDARHIAKLADDFFAGRRAARNGCRAGL